MNILNPFSLKAKVALVAGGAGYLARPICTMLAAQGAAVVIADLSLERGEAAVSEIVSALPQARLKCVVLDIGKEESIKSVVTQTVEAFGGIHIMVNTTMAAAGKLVDEISFKEFDSSLSVNLTGSFMLARESAKEMQEGGSIIMFSSMYGQVAPDPEIYELPAKPNPIEYGVGQGRHQPDGEISCCALGEARYSSQCNCSSTFSKSDAISE